MNSKETFKQHLYLTLYNPKNIIFNFIDKKKKRQSKEDTYDDLYYFILNLLKKNTKIIVKSKKENVSEIEFHKKYGWILGNNHYYAFLGKVDLCSTNIKINIGRNSYISGPSRIDGSGTLNIGAFTCIGENFHAMLRNDNNSKSSFSFINLRLERRLIYEGILSEPKNKIKIKQGVISIGNNVWIGRNVQVKNNVKIADNAVVGESSIIRKNVSTRTIVGGNPAKIINLIPKSEYHKLSWWNWEANKIKQLNRS